MIDAYGDWRVVWVNDLVERALAEWPALLAVIVLAGGHIYLSVVHGEPLRPLGIPLFAAIIVFVLAELARRFLFTD